uniref:KH domain-containing protein n=1 Tax=Elaeophora elaphi TaxID=1147741 RepID=A0A0R3RP57_9BILA
LLQEVGSIIGKRGDHIKFIRDQSGAKINISDGSCPERIVTITGSTGTINKAFGMICSKLQQDLQAFPNSIPKPPITMRLIVPATQCGCIIGKGGSKIKEIREVSNKLRIKG